MAEKQRVEKNEKMIRNGRKESKNTSVSVGVKCERNEDCLLNQTEVK